MCFCFNRYEYDIDGIKVGDLKDVWKNKKMVKKET